MEAELVAAVRDLVAPVVRAGEPAAGEAAGRRAGVGTSGRAGEAAGRRAGVGTSGRSAGMRTAGRRTVVGIAGPPGAGKSTLAEAVVADYGPSWGARSSAGAAVCVPLDGFHLSNVELDRLGLADRKGAPETFDAYGFVALLRRVREAAELVYAPAYSRILHESIGGVIPVPPEVELVVVEGNYLLLPDEPWSRARGMFDLTVYLDAPDSLRIAGLLQRQRDRGLDKAAARDWVYRSDEANARLVAMSRQYADAVLVRAGSTG